MSGARKVVTTYDASAQPFCWTARFGDYDLGDPVGVGETEAEAIADLETEAEEV